MSSHRKNIFDIKQVAVEYRSDVNTNRKYAEKAVLCFLFTFLFTHLADAFMQSNLAPLNLLNKTKCNEIR